MFPAPLARPGGRITPHDYTQAISPRCKGKIGFQSTLKTVCLYLGRAGCIGDGKISVFDLETAVRIRTGETGSDAL
jgi:nitrogen regulatory protein PII